MISRIGSRVDVVLVGYEAQENLGLRSIQATLRSQGYAVELLPFQPGEEKRVVRQVLERSPRLVGFSLIFQYALEEFAGLMRLLRSRGARAHFTVGGHYVSLRPEEALTVLPDADTVVRFEGELTLVELLGHLEAPERWTEVRGIAFRHGGAVVVTPPRPKLPDLDALPVPCRDHFSEVSPGVRGAAMLASRGCLFDCAFCSIRQFYGGAPGGLRRVRSPAAVVAEMLELRRRHEVRFFSFQDDDFAAHTESQRRWVRAFLAELDRAGLAGEVRWKISCRVTDLDDAILSEMEARGLAAVYLGVESGSETGLRTLNKGATVGDNRAAIELVKRHGLALAIGFMLFDPDSSVETIRENVAFLGWAGADGYFPVNFCKMLPYAGTPIEARLRSAGRLEGTVARPDYRFADPAVDWYEQLVQGIFSRRNFGSGGLVALQQRADFESRMAEDRVDPADRGGTGALRAIVARSNHQAVQTLSDLLEAVLTHGGERLLEERALLDELAEREWRAEVEAEMDMVRLGLARPASLVQGAATARRRRGALGVDGAT